MTQDLSLFNEVDEALKAEKLEMFLKNYGKLLVAGCLAIVLVTAASVFWKSHVKEVNAKSTEIVLEAKRLSDAGKYDQAVSALTEAEQGGRGIATIARLLHAEILTKTGKFADAAKIYNDIAEKRNTDEAIKDIASINSNILVSNHSLTGYDQKLPTEWNRPFSAMAGELAALRLQKEGKHKEAVDMLKEISGNPAVLSSERAVAKELLELINGEKQ